MSCVHVVAFSIEQQGIDLQVEKAPPGSIPFANHNLRKVAISGQPGLASTISLLILTAPIKVGHFSGLKRRPTQIGNNGTWPVYQSKTIHSFLQQVSSTGGKTPLTFTSK